MKPCTEINGKTLVVSGRLLRVCRLRDEYYEFVENPEEFLARLRGKHGVKADLFTFLQEIPDRTPKFEYHLEWDRAAVLRLGSFEDWWKKQINDKTRNMVRKAQKAGVDVRLAEFGAQLVEGIHRIYNESPVRQGRPFRHYGKNLQTIQSEHGTFLDRSQFLGAFFASQLIGFAKLVHGHGISNLMNIISLISYRDKAPTNALIAKAVEICASRGVPYLQYGTGNTGSIGDFKRHHAFEETLVPRYYVPLDLRGAVLLGLGFHRPVEDRIPQSWRTALAMLRRRWNEMRSGNSRSGSGTEPQAERQRAKA
jgi:hypothetical protein